MSLDFSFPSSQTILRFAEPPIEPLGMQFDLYDGKLGDVSVVSSHSRPIPALTLTFAAPRL